MTKAPVKADGGAVKNDPTPEERTREELDLMLTAGVAEVASRNPNVLDAMRHWEGRAEKAEAALAALNAPPPPPPPVKRARVNRGNTRRIMRALEAFTKACDDAARDFDLLAYTVDDEGKRTGEWPTLAAIRAAKDEVQRASNALISGDA